MSKEITITLMDENGKEQTYQAGKVMARTTRDAMKMYAKMEEVDKDGKAVVRDDESLDMMIELVADSIFKKVPEVTVDSILDGLEADKLLETLQSIVGKAMGMEEEDIKEATEGK